MKAAMTAEAERTCEYCVECGFLAGQVNWAAFPFLPAMDYQHRVSTMLGGGAPVLSFQPQVPRIQEWALPDANSGNGRRSFDGFNQALCLLIEAKLGYADYMRNSTIRLPVMGVAGETVPVYEVIDDAVAAGRMATVLRQMQNHQFLAIRYPLRRAGWQFFHHILWCCSNHKLNIFCWGSARANGWTRLIVRHVPVGTLPASIWRT